MHTFNRDQFTQKLALAKPTLSISFPLDRLAADIGFSLNSFYLNGHDLGFHPQHQNVL